MESLRQSLNPNKLLKEEFVSNLTGSSMLEVAALSTIIPGLVVLRQWSSFSRVNVKINVEASTPKKDGCVAPHRRDFRSYAVSLSVDYLCIVLPVLLILTILAEWVHMFTLLLIVVLLLCISAKGSSYIHLKGEQLSSLRATITSYRVLVVIMTCLSILAVDFKIFPRRYAKTETYGTSMMDLGVGSFVIVNALVSRKARNSISMNWMATLKSTSPLILLGFGRLISTTGVDYQAHVGEYGVHWNFFFTLAAVSLLSSLCDIDPKYCGIVGLLILVGYQACLLYGLNVYLLSNERMADIVSQNKEGLFSIFGYWGMYLIGVHLGHYILFGNHSSLKARNIQATRATVWIVCVLFWFLTIILDKYVERVSRRMCNLAYVTQVIAQNFQVLSILTLSDFIPYEKSLAIEEAFNQNLLGSFLMANVLTGLVNLSMDTLSASPVTSFTVLLGYSFLLSFVTSILWFCGIKIKFW
ncbi:uncharacterized protein At4g17910-like isoform X1 [Zingiber officinale]|uniref:uncharacterized protein At4g17910-like isoform X1 n=1 Tax=Zingiber officinale TaxID=94328 RepID=UPI001C4C3338|nr:uncharacterized protein At4g17910-like isoform X1 [Zingiber officinale]